MPRTVERLSLMSMTPGTGRTLNVIRYGRAGARPKVYLQASIHSGEFPGAMALHHLIPMLDRAQKAGRVKGQIVVVPHANPIGLSQVLMATHLGRYDFFGRDNFNRNYHDLADPVAERIKGRLTRNAQRNINLIRAAGLAVLDEMIPSNEIQQQRLHLMKRSIDADVVIDLHCDAQASMHHFISQRDWPAIADLSAQIGATAVMYNSPYPLTMTFSGCNGSWWSKLADRFPDYPIPQACQSSTIEYRGQNDVNDAYGAADAANLYKFLQRRGVVSGNPGPLPRARCTATPMEGMDVGYAPAPGVLVYKKLEGSRVRRGETICEVIDPQSVDPLNARTPMKSTTDGVLFSRRPDGRPAWPGMVCFRIAGPKALPHRKGRSGLDD
ncbi:MAG: succinylglutamate desuccinylase/aspartoacylase family protein [Alphaproteobacteria bacterium]|nr:succinylglutamate desuccinylase/aspartoacylase family protein [Alphaproteobacteria bacterium]